MWDQLFGLTNMAALLGWAVLLLGPRRWLPVVRYAVVGFLCAIYVLLFGLLLAGLVDPGRDGPIGAFEYSVRGLRAQFASDGAIVVGWTHYLAFDLFVGCWIAADADRRGVRRWAQAPVLLATFLAGPVGLLVWFVLKRFGSPSPLRGEGA
ncbi:MAG: rane protein [Sphingomonas bacterium]|uniref:ABA4-like family protein n=1 Tax=Sphingomonas bacterium TaxID=1895847 RepID=UPI002615BE75|nr:ABA4-like family protein [Sphingomonas bacterium]MDB5695124.1 rane protein [Sphingomonas bacterium]